MRAGRSQLDVAEALAANLAKRDFHAAFVADHAAVLHALVLAAQALPVGDGAKNLGAEQAVAFRLKGAVIDSLRLGDFAVRPGTNFLGTRQADANGIEIGDQTGAIIRAAAIQGCFLPPQLSPGPRPRPASLKMLTGTAENPTTKTTNSVLLDEHRLKPVLPNPRLCPSTAFAASSIQRPGRVTATRGQGR